MRFTVLFKGFEADCIEKVTSPKPQNPKTPKPQNPNGL